MLQLPPPLKFDFVLKIVPYILLYYISRSHLNIPDFKIELRNYLTQTTTFCYSFQNSILEEVTCPNKGTNLNMPPLTKRKSNYYAGNLKTLYHARLSDICNHSNYIHNNPNPQPEPTKTSMSLNYLTDR